MVENRGNKMKRPILEMIALAAVIYGVLLGAYWLFVE
jgi:hypothetical protein